MFNFFMNYLFKTIIVWISKYFPFLLKIFDLKVLEFGHIDVTPDYYSGYRPIKRMIESKISWIIYNRSFVNLPISIIFTCPQEEDCWIQVYQVDSFLNSKEVRDICCEKETYDAELGQKQRSTIVPAQGLLKVDFFASQEPHPVLSSDMAFQIVPNDKKIRIIQSDFFNRSSLNFCHWLIRFLFIISFIILLAVIFAHICMQYVYPMWKYFIT
ncbi:MAG: hypothetical protein JXA94_00230 [Parachlamydiales bacterium]|nr:hypothetical protein [Parachlamydiales bacterium]